MVLKLQHRHLTPGHSLAYLLNVKRPHAKVAMHTSRWKADLLDHYLALEEDLLKKLTAGAITT